MEWKPQRPVLVAMDADRQRCQQRRRQIVTDVDQFRGLRSRRDERRRQCLDLAGGNITNLAVSLPTTWYLSNNNTTVNTVGGGNLTVTTGGNILSGDYFVAEGTGTLNAGGLIGSSGLLTATSFGNARIEVSTLLAAQDGVFNVSARQGVDIGAMVDPSYLQGGALAQRL